MLVFQGHRILAMLGNLALADTVLLSIVLFVIVYKGYKNPLLKLGILGVITFLVIFFWPNSAYLMLEVKHLVMVDTVADDPNLMSYLVFGGLSLIGFVLTVLGNRIMIDHLTDSKIARTTLNLILSLISGIGGVAGFLDLYSIQGILAPKLLAIFTLRILTSPPLAFLAIGVSLLLFMTNIFLDLKKKPS